jgi:glycosyltransferase involved in cell wall biosynthesis
MKVLISAYVCEPNSSSEAEVGWQWVNHLSKFHELVVITKRPQSLQNVEKFIKENKNLRFEYYDLPKIFDFMRTGDIRHFIYYNLWQIGAYFHARKLVKKEKFDLVHHLVYVNTWQPTYMAFLGIPFIYGPIGENPRVPYKIIKNYGWKTFLRDTIISYARYVSKNFNPLVRKIYHRASRIIVINKEIYFRMPEAIKEKTYIMPAVGVSLPNIDLDNKTSKNNKFIVLYVGRFVYMKAPDIALEAFLKFAEKYNNVELIMIGSGKLEFILKKIIQSSADKHKVKLLEWLDRKEVMEYMRRCDVFLFPTLEGGGMVVLEAMSCGKPIICMDYGGPKDFVSDECGIKIPLTNRKQIINDLSEALDKLYNDNDLRLKLGRAARKRVEDYYTWDKKVEWMNQVYLDLLK